MSSAPTKVLHIIKSLGRGGAEMLLPETLKLHNKNEFEFHYIYFLPWKNQMVQSILQNGGRVTCVAARNNVLLMSKIGRVVRYVRENRIQLIHAHLPWAGILARVVGKLSGIPVIYTEHNKQERYHFGTRRINLLTMNLLTEIIAVSADVEESIIKNKATLKIPVRTIVNGVNTDHFSRSSVSGRAVRDRFNFAPDDLVVGTIAVFRFQKRLDLWLELAAEILKQISTAKFIVVGDGPLRNELIKRRDALGLKGIVHFAGLETEVRPFLASFDLYMMSSIFEGLPVALLEAMSMECPVIATDAGGIKEVIRHEVDGMLCPVDEPGKLVGYACSLLQDPVLRLNYGAEGRRRVQEKFSMQKMVMELEGVYREIMGRRTRE